MSTLATLETTRNYRLSEETKLNSIDLAFDIMEDLTGLNFVYALEKDDKMWDVLTSMGCIEGKQEYTSFMEQISGMDQEKLLLSLNEVVKSREELGDFFKGMIWTDAFLIIKWIFSKYPLIENI